MKRTLRIAGLLSVVLLLPACGTVSGWFGNKTARLPEISAQFTPAVVWSEKIGAADDYEFVPAADGHAVYFASGTGELARYDGLHGKLIWRINTMHALSAGVGLGDGEILLGTPKGEVLAFDPDGKGLWKSQVSGEILSAPQAAEGVVVVRTSDGRIFGLDGKDGKRKWVYQRATPALTVRSYAGVTITQGAVFAGFAGGKLVAINLQSGLVGWEVAVSQPRGTTELERISDITSLPIIDELQVCTVAYQGRTGCYDLANGEQIWVRNISSAAGLVVNGRSLYVVDENGAVHSLDSSTGASNWKQDALSGRRLGTPYVQGNYLVVGDDQGYVHFLDRADGTLVARLQTDGSAVLGQPIRLDADDFLLQTSKGQVFALTIP